MKFELTIVYENTTRDKGSVKVILSGFSDYDEVRAKLTNQFVERFRKKICPQYPAVYFTKVVAEPDKIDTCCYFYKEESWKMVGKCNFRNGYITVPVIGVLHKCDNDVCVFTHNANISFGDVYEESSIIDIYNNANDYKQWATVPYIEHITMLKQCKASQPVYFTGEHGYSLTDCVENLSNKESIIFIFHDLPLSELQRRIFELTSAHIPDNACLTFFYVRLNVLGASDSYFIDCLSWNENGDMVVSPVKLENLIII